MSLTKKVLYFFKTIPKEYFVENGECQQSYDVEEYATLLSKLKDISKLDGELSLSGPSTLFLVAAIKAAITENAKCIKIERYSDGMIVSLEGDTSRELVRGGPEAFDGLMESATIFAKFDLGPVEILKAYSRDKEFIAKWNKEEFHSGIALKKSLLNKRDGKYKFYYMGKSYKIKFTLTDHVILMQFSSDTL